MPHLAKRTRNLIRYARPLALLGVLVLWTLPTLVARSTEPPRSYAFDEKALETVDLVVLQKIDREALLAEDLAMAKSRRSPGPLRFAIGEKVRLNPQNSGTWQALPDGRLWRLRIRGPGAVSMNLGISRLALAEGAKLWLYDPAQKRFEGAYTVEQRNNKGGLYTPIIEGDEIVVELFVPAEAGRSTIEISVVNKGYRGLGDISPDKQGGCNNDVVCPEGDPWRDQIASVARYTINGASLCSGQLMNNTNVDFTPYFLSAYHCGVSATNDHTLVFYWNFESPNCGDLSGGSLAENQTGSTFRASYSPSDFLLVELDAAPVAANAFFTGWDATGTAPASTVGIHHPSGDEKAISFDNDAPTSTAYDSNTVNPAANHWRVIAWDDGTTEGGSSGSCLWDEASQLCIGQLHGGYASCTSNTSDWYGKLSVSWEGGGTSSSRLRDWLDPGNTGALSLNGDPHVTTLDGTRYDFQGAGEYTILRDPGLAEVQVRQAPIATTFNPGPNAYHGLATCVSLNTAVAVEVAGRRVTYQPGLDGVPNPEGLDLRIDGNPVSLGPDGIDLGRGASIVPTDASGGLEIRFPQKYVLQVTPGWWSSQSKWYLNVGVSRVASTAAGGLSLGDGAGIGGLAAPIAARSWLPPLPDGSSMGPMPSSLDDRYEGLYEKFGEAWRVTDDNTLFDYAEGMSTASFTLKSWPGKQPPCTLPDTDPVEPTSLEIARQACAEIRDQHLRAECVFDVRVTGHLGFADTYLRTEGLQLEDQPVRPTRTSHFQCYEVKDARARYRPPTVALQDQFGESKTRLGRITRICNPVRKNRERVPDWKTHLVCYEIEQREDAGRKVAVRNQFGAARLAVGASSELCLPSTKKELDGRKE